MPTEQELLQKIEDLELENSALRDKLDMIYAIVAPEDSEEGNEEPGEEPGTGFVQINGTN